jgi:DDE superfamily endonuclease
VHLIVDNYATHKHPKVRTWLAQRPCYHIHYTPTYSSWLNQVDRWFALITQRAIRRGSFRCVKGPDPEDRFLCAALQPLAPPLRLDCNCRFDPAKDRKTLFTYFRDTTLACSR